MPPAKPAAKPSGRPTPAVKPATSAKPPSGSGAAAVKAALALPKVSDQATSQPPVLPLNTKPLGAPEEIERPMTPRANAMTVAAAPPSPRVGEPPPPPSPMMRWVTSKTGDGVTLSDDEASASRAACAPGSSGYSCQLANQWMNKDVTTIALVCEEVSAETTIGIIGRNFWPSEWDLPMPTSLTSSAHAVVVKSEKGKVNYKGRNTSFILKPLTSGMKLNVIIDMQTREVTFEVVGAEGDQVLSSLAVENIPPEVALVVGFGPSESEQRVRIVGSKTERPEMRLEGKTKKDLWDDDNVIAPLTINSKNMAPSALKAKMAEIAIAQGLEN